MRSTKQNTGWGQGEITTKPLQTKVLFPFFIRSEVFAVVLKVLKCVCIGIMGISTALKESRCTRLDCTAGRLSPALLQFQILCCQPSPEKRGCSFCLRNSSQAWPTHLFWSESAAEQPPFISCTQNFLPNDNLLGRVCTTYTSCL